MNKIKINLRRLKAGIKPTLNDGKNWIMNRLKIFIIFSLKSGFKWIIATTVSLFLIIPLTNNILDISKLNDAALDFYLSQESLEVSDEKHDFGIGGYKGFPYPQENYNVILSGKITISSGTPTAVYLVYSNFDQPITKNDFYPINLDDIQKPSEKVYWANILPHFIGQYLSVEKYQSTLKFEKKIEYSRSQSTAQRKPYQPLYILLIDKDGKSNISVLGVNATPNAIINKNEFGEVVPSPIKFHSKVVSKYYSGIDFLGNTHPHIDDSRFISDRKQIESIVRDHF